MIRTTTTRIMTITTLHRITLRLSPLINHQFKKLPLLSLTLITRLSKVVRIGSQRSIKINRLLSTLLYPHCLCLSTSSIGLLNLECSYHEFILSIHALLSYLGMFIVTSRSFVSVCKMRLMR